MLRNIFSSSPSSNFFHELKIPSRSPKAFGRPLKPQPPASLHFFGQIRAIQKSHFVSKKFSNFENERNGLDEFEQGK